LLAVALGESGMLRVREALTAGAAISSVNWTEALSRLADLGMDPAAEAARLTRLVRELLTIVPFDVGHAEHAARLRPLTRHLGLSLGDRACLALGLELALPVLTADRSWNQLDPMFRVELIR
jgi:ribonuclease VapC